MKRIIGYIFGQSLLTILMVVLNFNFIKFQEVFFVWFLIIKSLLLIGLTVLTVNLLVELFKLKRFLFLLPFISVFLTLMILELIFSFVPRSHHAEESYASMIWQHYYYKTNSQGFRDNSLKKENMPSLVFIGDSYTAGYGIRNEADRFSNIVGDSLRENFEFYNFGLKGTGLNTHKTLLKKNSGFNKVLIYQVLINDLDDYCSRHAPLYNIYSTFTNRDYLVAKSSFLFNYLYFNFPNKKIEEEYFNFFNNCYQNKEVFDQYKNDLLSFVKSAKVDYGFQEVILVVVPSLSDLELSKNFDTELMEYMQENNETLVIYPMKELETYALSERIINIHDSHPSKNVHRLIAYKLLQTGVLNGKKEN